MSDEALPKRVYIEGKRKMVGVRLPEQLVKELEKIGKDSGWSLTDVVQTALDQYVQGFKGKNKK